MMRARSILVLALFAVGTILIVTASAAETGGPTPASAAPAQAEPQNPSLPDPSQALIPLAHDFLNALVRQDFNAAAADFDETMTRVSGPDKLAAFWKPFTAQFGALKSQPEARYERLGSYDIILVACEFEKEKLLARVVFDSKKRIAGFGFAPYYPPAKYEPPAYADPKLFDETEVTVGSGEWTLPGTLTLPKGAGPFPGLVLVHGSGPNGRDESIGPNKPFQDLAWGLASRGIAVLRYDKRTMAYAARYKADPALLAALTVKEETIDDAVAAARVLQASPKVNRRKIFILGHSLGGMLIPRIVLAARSLDPAGFIIMAGLTRPLDETIIQQMTYLAHLGGAPDEETSKKLDEYRALMDKVRALKPSDAGSKEVYLGAGASYWLDMKGYYPPDVAKGVKQPLLILQGGRDYQVTTEDFDNWKKAIGDRPDATFKLYPLANHLFFEGKGIITPNEYEYTHGSVAEPVVKDIADWIDKVGSALR